MDECFPPVSFKGRMKLMKLSAKVVAPAVGSKWQRYHVAMKYLPRCLRMHLADRPDRVQNEAALPMPDDKKVCQKVFCSTTVHIWKMSCRCLDKVCDVC